MDNYRRQNKLEAKEESGEKAEPPHRDEVRTSFVPDDDAAEYEEQQPGIRISYTLKRPEIYEALRHSGSCRTTVRKTWIRTAVLAACLLIFLVCGLVRENGGIFLRFSVICALLIVMIWLVPFLERRRRAVSLADGREISLAVYPDVIEIGRDAGAWKILLDGSAELSILPKIILVYEEDRMLMIPQRCIGPSIHTDVLAMLIAGTRKHEED